MAEVVIFPAQPLFMVDRSWQRRTRRLKTKSGRFAGHGPPSRTPEVTITVAKSSVNTASSHYKRDVSSATKETQSAPTGLQFMSYEPSRSDSPTRQTQGKKRIATTPNAIGRSKEKDPRRKSPLSSGRKHTGTTTLRSTLGDHVPGTASPLYSLIEPEASAFQGFVSYYSTHVAAALFPISKYIPLQYNPIQTVWLPAAVSDKTLLHTILFSSAQHYRACRQDRHLKDSEILMKVILDSLNRRLSTNSLSDVTIGAVSCLALSENQLGHHDKWAMHNAGMSEMIHVRGGVESIQDVMRMKIYRADIIGAVDTLTRPRLPRPPRTTLPLDRAMILDVRPNEALTSMLAGLRLSSRLFEAFLQLSCLCRTLDQAAKEQIPLDPRAYDEDLTCIQHDMLMSNVLEESGVEKLCRLTGLVFVQTLTREKPFMESSATLLSGEMRTSLASLHLRVIPPTLLFWMLFMGGLVSSATPDKGWYARRLHDYQTSRGGPNTWNDARNQLKQIMWVDGIQDAYGKKLWSWVESPLRSAE
ncbi:hypothetical protein A1O1_08025 [Capronia coronata CBS 617.96]|uniref:Transcription factor domain-containing protein n=1 Tax=Capronia coronata CBS 617.96 TaxID=1182541 RepID=W9XP31_9EURO|nr:uncharacterized protein A1O1_08025 [Capronia coronata CBS 617.96]EXJ81958.1 hypothetical protein A1O1_08025 [Capronia coronata CBS 617.96]